MTESSQQFDWTIDERRSWPPHVRPSAPYSPSSLEIMRDCPLRASFERSPGYERRMGFAARVGTAFHQTLEYLNNHPPIGTNTVLIMDQTRQYFFVELGKQEAEQNRHPRERGLPRDETRADRALNAVITEALRLGEEASVVHGGYHAKSGNFLKGRDFHKGIPDEAAVQVEIPVQSKDDIFHGRIDRAERTPEGIVLYDYKSALREDLPERYERQLQLYAWLWFETFGEWPVRAEVIYPLKGTSHAVAVDQETCLRVVDEYRQTISDVQQEKSAERLARPSSVCQVCDFRPWCRAFWRWQSSESRIKPALERAHYGFEGNIIEIKIVDYHWMVRIGWHNVKIKIIAPQERFPQLENATSGMHIRALDMELNGLITEPRARVTSLSEIFLVHSE